MLCVSPLLACMFHCPIRLHLQDTSSKRKSLRISRWQQQSIIPSAGPYVTAGSHTCEASPACWHPVFGGLCHSQVPSVPHAPFSLCSLGWPGMEAGGGRECGQLIQPHHCLLPPPNSQTEPSTLSLSKPCCLLPLGLGLLFPLPQLFSELWSLGQQHQHQLELVRNADSWAPPQTG